MTPATAALVALAMAQSTADAPRPSDHVAEISSARPLATLSSIPNVSVSYYDVPGKNVEQLHRWLEKHASRDPQTHKTSPASSSWSIETAVKWLNVGGQCRLTEATLRFVGKAELPRIVPGQEIEPRVLTAWNAYVAQLEDRQAVQLRFVRDRMGDVEKAVLQSSCDKWQAVADAAIARLEEQQRLAFKPNPVTQPKLAEPG